MHPDTFLIGDPRETDNATTKRAPTEGDSTASMDQTGPPPYPGPPTLAYGFFRVVGDSVFITTGTPPRPRGAAGGRYGGSPTCSFRRSSSSAALHLVRACWATLFIASMLFIAGVAATGLAYAKGVDFRSRRHGVLMILAAGLIVMAASAVGIYKIVKNRNTLLE